RARAAYARDEGEARRRRLRRQDQHAARVRALHPLGHREMGDDIEAVGDEGAVEIFRRGTTWLRKAAPGVRSGRSIIAACASGSSRSTRWASSREMKPIPPRVVKDGPILQNVLEGDACDVLRFPVPRHHEADTSRFIGTADCVITQDPDAGWFNLGAYRSQVYDGRTIGCQITEGKHGRIHRDKYFARGQPMKVVILCG